MPTQQEIEIAWSLVGKIGVALTCLVGIIKSVKYLKSQTSVAKLEKRVSIHDDYLTTDKRRLDEMDKKIKSMETDRIEESRRINESLTMLGTSLTAILNHMIDGNGIEEMKKEREQLQNFFIKR
jgi:hypothetical protein